ncbi:MAG TPA: hypothetical protein VEZ40_03015, partial [Pyrinomonadaceae bacterium]|nr:hypothetical protein [Pyrinomonadaceae bacterium]
MGDETSRAELASLAEEVGENLTYLRELGVEFLDSASTFETGATAAQFEHRSPTARPPEARRSAALQRNAEAEARIERKPPADAPPAPPKTHAPPT